MEDSTLQTKQTTVPNLHTLAVPDLNDEPPSPFEIVDTKHWPTRHDSHAFLISPSQKNNERGSLLKGTNLLKRFQVEDSARTNEPRSNNASPPSSPTTTRALMDPAKQSILKTSKSGSLRPQKSVTINEDNKDQISRIVTLDRKNSNQQGLARARSISEEPKNIGDKFKKFFCRLKQPSCSVPKAAPTKDSQLEPQVEQLKILNRNLNPWESQEEKLSRLRARHRKSIKGLTLRKKASFQTLPTPTVKRVPGNSIKSSWAKWKASILQSIKIYRLVLQPDGKIRIVWDLIGMIFILYELLMIPLKISFDFDTTGFVDGFELLIDIFFLSDIMLNFNTGYYYRGSLVVDRKKIALNYIQTWLAMDTLASFPYSRIIEAADSIDDNGNSSSWISQSTRIIRIIRFFRFIRVIRLIRIFKLKSILGKLESFISLTPALNAFIGFLRISTIILFIAHWIACFWHLIADLEFGDQPDTWIVRQGLQDAPWSSKYLSSIYFAVTTMVTVGYGDIFPVTDSEKVYTLFTMLLASVVFAYSMSSISALLTSLDLANQEYKKTVVWVERYMKQMKLDLETRQKVKKYLEYTLNEVSFRKDDETRLLGLLSDSLKDEVIKKINKGVLVNCESLERLLKKIFPERFIMEMIYFFQERIYSPGETICEDNEHEGSIHMITMGSVEITVPLTNGEMVLNTLKRGEHFGEVEFFTGMNRRWGAKAAGEFLSLFYLKRIDLLDLLDSFQNEKETFFQIKDKICLYQDYTGIEYKCSMCRRPYHTPLECPTMHCIVDRETLLQDQIKDMYKFRQSFVRRSRIKWHHKNDKTLETSALRIRKDYSNFIEDAENEAQSPRQRSPDDSRVSYDLSAPNSVTRTNRRQKSLIENFALEALDPRERTPSKVLKAKKEVVKKPVKGQFEVGFDAVMSYINYFPMNNVEYVIDKMNEKLRLARKMKRIKAIRRVIMFTSAARKSAEKKNTVVVGSAHDYGVGAIKFKRSKSEEKQSEGTEEVMFTKGIPEVSDEENEEKQVNVAEEEIKFNKDFHQENHEFNKKMEFKLLNDVGSPNIVSAVQPDRSLEDDEMPDIIVNINLVDTNEELDPSPGLKEPESKTNSTAERDYNLVSQMEINRLLSHVIEKYGTGYVRDIINKKDNYEYKG